MVLPAYNADHWRVQQVLVTKGLDSALESGPTGACGAVGGAPPLLHWYPAGRVETGPQSAALAVVGPPLSQPSGFHALAQYPDPAGIAPLLTTIKT